MQARPRWVVLVAMTLANSMILVDQTAVPLSLPSAMIGLGAPPGDGQWVLTANVLPLAAFMVLGGRLGDLLGLKRVFLAGATLFIAASALAGGAQSAEWLIAVRAAQGVGAALMMPTSIAIVSAVSPESERGRALGLLAGASAFFAALGPVLGGALTELDWRLVFFINVPLAGVTIALTAATVPPLAPADRTARIDWTGAALLAAGLAGLVFGLSQGQEWGWGSLKVLAPLVGGIALLVALVVVELRKRRRALVDFGLFRHLNFLAANVSQVLAGMVELGMGFVLPYYLLLALELSPGEAGLALLPATVPIILAGPLTGRAFDRIGGRVPLTVGFIVLAAAGAWLAITVDDLTWLAIAPGLVLQGLGLGIVLTANDPTGMNAVPDEERGEAAGAINTTEQLGGAVGIALLGALMIGTYRSNIRDLVAEQGLNISTGQVDQLKAFLERGLAKGLDPSQLPPGLPDRLLLDAGDAFISAFQLTMAAVVVISLLGALAVGLLVRRGDPTVGPRVRMRRSRWRYMGRAPGGRPGPASGPGHGGPAPARTASAASAPAPPP